MSKISSLQCACGQTKIEVTGAPIMVTECLCNSCRDAAKRFVQLENGKDILTSYGATRCGEYRKDRVRFISGQEYLREFRLKPEAGTRRVVSACCNTPIFIEMKGGHWVSLYSQLWRNTEMPPVDTRTMTGDLADPTVLPNDEIPNLKQHSIPFYIKLFGSWVGMGFRNPKIEVKGTLNV